MPADVRDDFRPENVAAALTGDRPRPYAGCPDCRVPLIATFAFSGAEFYCLECGGLFGWLAPVRLDATPEMDELHSRLEREWGELGGPKLIGGGMMLKGCETCRVEGRPHAEHATDDERAAHEEAVEALAARLPR